MLRYDTTRGIWREVDGAGALAAILVAAGAPVDGQKGVPETPLITAASYGDAGVARVLIGAGADLEARSSDDAGGVPGGTALLHAAVFGMSAVVDVLVEAGARIEGIEVAAAVGDVTEWLAGAAPDSLTRALVMAAQHERPDVIDRLLALGTPVDAVDPVFGGHPLRAAAQAGRPGSVGQLLAAGADPNLRDNRRRTPLDLCRKSRAEHEGVDGYREVEAILVPITDP